MKKGLINITGGSEGFMAENEEAREIIEAVGREVEMEFTFERLGGIGVLAFAGMLTVERSAKLRELLLVSLENSDHLVVNFNGVSEMDIFCRQMFCSAYRMSLRTNKRMTLSGLDRNMFQWCDGEEEHFCDTFGAHDCAVTCIWNVTSTACIREH